MAVIPGRSTRWLARELMAMTVEAPANIERALASVAPKPVPVIVGSQSSGLPRDSAANAPWLDPRLLHDAEWEVFARFPNFWEGRVLAGLLENEGLPAVVESMWPGPDLRSYSIVLVPASLVHRARWILSWPAPSEAELTFLATGKFPDAESGTK
jgi:hypothetical protein